MLKAKCSNPWISVAIKAVYIVYKVYRVCRVYK